MPDEPENAAIPQLNAYRIRELERWRDEEARPALRTLRREVDAMTKADEIADAVAVRVRKDRAVALTLVQKVGLIAFMIASPVVSAALAKVLFGI